MKVGTRKRGSKWSYYFDIGKVEGKRKKIEKGGFATEPEALSAGRRAATEYEDTGRIQKQSNESVADHLDYWYKECVLVDCKPNTQRSYERFIRLHIKPEIGNLKLKSVSGARLQELLNSKFRSGLARNSIRIMYGILSKSFGMAVHPYEKIKANPMEHVRIPKGQRIKKKDENKTITPTQFDIITERYPQGTPPYVPFQIGYHAGFRPGEILALEWPCVDLEAKTATVRGTQGKNDDGIYIGTPKTEGSYRTIEIGDTLVEILKEHKEWQDANRKKYGEYYYESDFVCTHENGTPVRMGSLHYYSRMIRANLGIQFTTHYLRHTHASILIELGINLQYIADRLGHTLQTLLDTYAHVIEKVKVERNSVSKFEDHIKNLPPNS